MYIFYDIFMSFGKPLEPLNLMLGVSARVFARARHVPPQLTPLGSGRPRKAFKWPWISQKIDGKGKYIGTNIWVD